jgi:hypothetical protein
MRVFLLVRTDYILFKPCNKFLRIARPCLLNERIKLTPLQKALPQILL